jgi:hypothetical protein
MFYVCFLSCLADLRPVLAESDAPGSGRQDVASAIAIRVMIRVKRGVMIF